MNVKNDLPSILHQKRMSHIVQGRLKSSTIFMISLRIAIQIALEEAKVSVFPFFIGKEDRMWLGRSAYADDI